MLLPAKCLKCGELIEVNSEMKAANCKFCGVAFVVEDAIKNFNTYFKAKSNGFGGAKKQEDTSKDFIIEGGVLKKYHGQSLEVVIPNGVLGIGENCFKGLKIKSVVVPDSVESISKCAFLECDKLSSVKFGKGLINIEINAFSVCNSLTSIVFPRSVKKIASYAFSRCTNLTSVVVSNSLTNIEEWAFDNCTKLTTVKMPENSSNINNLAFSNTPFYEKRRKEALVAERKKSGICQHCGGAFKRGLFGSHCIVCGTPKDY